MNKRGEGEGLFLILILLLVFGLYSAIENSNPYNTYMDDCHDLYKKDFVDGQCVEDTNSSWDWLCQDEDKIKRFCQDKWDRILSSNDANCVEGEQDG